MNRQAIIDKAAKRAERLPLAGLSAGSVGTATAFFFLAMPSATLAGLVGSGGLLARLAVSLIAAVLTAAVVLRVFARLDRREPPEAELDLDDVIPTGRKRSIGVPIEPSGPPQLRRGDVHPDAPARRPIFAADELGAPLELDTPVAEAPAAQARPAVDPDPAEAKVVETPAVDPVEPVLDLETVVADEAEESAPAADQPVEEPQPEPAAGDSISTLMARLEGGLDRRAHSARTPEPNLAVVEPAPVAEDEPAPAAREAAETEPAPVTPIKPRGAAGSDEALRNALDALQRIAARQR